MQAFEQGDIVKVPFPHTDRATRQYRPALVVSADAVQRQHGLLWVLMITSAANRGWRVDVEIVDLVLAGLPAPSVVRCAKIATIEAADASRLGQLAASTLSEVLGHVRRGLQLR